METTTRITKIRIKTRIITIKITTKDL